MLKSPLTLCLCSTFFLLPVSTTNGKSGLFALSGRSDRKSVVSSATVPKIQMNRQGMRFVKNYIKKSSHNLTRIQHRSEGPFSIIDSVFSLYKLPAELKYLAVIESELKPTAVSHVGAVGPWQLMPATARILGLKTSSGNDERRNYYKSTRAAARYLRDLHREFGDWLLVIAAYNGGPAPVHRAIRQSHSRNFWVLQPYLPSETRQHVKRFIATQYFFEGHGSLTTLTRAEGIRYTNKLRELAAISAEASPTKEIAPGRQESSGERFERLMKKSEELLQKSNLLLEENK